MKLTLFIPKTIAVVSDGVYTFMVEQIAQGTVRVTKLLFGDIVDENTYTADNEAIDAMSKGSFTVTALVELTGEKHVKPIFDGAFTGKVDVLGSNHAEELIAVANVDNKPNGELKDGLAVWSEECAISTPVIVVSNWNEI
jgi:ABC-type Zn uptake system ZnuABC Zn-binding protein ZnuA